MLRREISRGLNLYLPKDEREGKEARRLKPQGHGGICDMLRAHRPRLLLNCIEMDEGANERSNERTNTWRITWIRLFLYSIFSCVSIHTKNWAPSTWMAFVFRICCYLCCFAFCCWFFFSNHKCANRFKTPSTHDVLITAEWPKEWTTEGGRERTNEHWSLIGT